MYVDEGTLSTGGSESNMSNTISGKTKMARLG